MAIKGLIHISCEPKLLGSKEWTLQRTELQPGEDLPKLQRELLQSLFASSRTLAATPPIAKNGWLPNSPCSNR